MNFDPETFLQTNNFFACMPDRINDFQKKSLEDLKNKHDGEFFSFGVFNRNVFDFKNIMQKEDCNKNNFYLIDVYIKQIYQSLKL